MFITGAQHFYVRTTRADLFVYTPHSKASSWPRVEIKTTFNKPVLKSVCVPRWSSTISFYFFINQLLTRLPLIIQVPIISDVVDREGGGLAWEVLCSVARWRWPRRGISWLARCSACSGLSSLSVFGLIMAAHGSNGRATKRPRTDQDNIQRVSFLLLTGSLL